MGSNSNRLRPHLQRRGKIVELIFLILALCFCLPTLLFGNWFVSKYAKFATKPAAMAKNQSQDPATTAKDASVTGTEEESEPQTDLENHERLESASNASPASGGPLVESNQFAVSREELPPGSNSQTAVTDTSLSDHSFPDTDDDIAPIELPPEPAVSNAPTNTEYGFSSHDEPADEPLDDFMADDETDELDSDIDFEAPELMPPAERTWTTTGGRQADATFVRMDGEVVILERGEKQFKIPLKVLSDDDLTYLDSLR